MPISRAALLTPARSAAILAEAVRRVDTSIPGPVDLDVSRRTLEIEQAKGAVSLVTLMKVGRRRVLDRIRRMARKAGERASARAPPP